MIREFMIGIGEWAFLLTGGVPLANSVLGVVWVLIGALIMALPPVIATRWVQRTQPGTDPRRWAIRAGIFSLVLFFPMLFTTVGVPILQMESLTECRQTEGRTGFDQTEMPVIVTECRDRVNLNRWADFGDWTVRSVVLKR